MSSGHGEYHGVLRLGINFVNRFPRTSLGSWKPKHHLQQSFITAILHQETSNSEVEWVQFGLRKWTCRLQAPPKLRPYGALQICLLLLLLLLLWKDRDL